MSESHTHLCPYACNIVHHQLAYDKTAIIYYKEMKCMSFHEYQKLIFFRNIMRETIQSLSHFKETIISSSTRRLSFFYLIRVMLSTIVVQAFVTDSHKVISRLFHYSNNFIITKMREVTHRSFHVNKYTNNEYITETYMCHQMSEHLICT